MDKINQYINQNRNKNILIWGLGLQGGGESAVRFFSRFTQNIRITDLKTEFQLIDTIRKLSDLPISYSLGGHNESDFFWADIILINQDIFNKSPNSPFLKLALDLGKKIETQTGLFFKLCHCPIIGITGTRGKTTTAVAANFLLQNAGYKTLLGGNIPNSDNLANISETKDIDYAVLELSNFQLHGLNFEKISPHIAIITSISPDHLISYQNPKDYLEDKKTICKYQNLPDYLIINSDISEKNFFLQEIRSQIIEFNDLNIPANWTLKLFGKHNRQNLAAVYQLAKILNINSEIIKNSICNFSGVKYRLEKIAEYKGISFINDTTASSPKAATIALESFPSGKIIWLAGGNSKKLPQEELIKTASAKVKKFILLEGDATKSLELDLSKHTNAWSEKYLGTYSNFKQAIELAWENANAGDIILLSPGFTSFALFNNEFERGDQFNQLVQKIISAN